MSPMVPTIQQRHGRGGLWLWPAAALLATVGCGGAAAPDGQPEAPPVVAKHTPTRVDLDAIFPPGPGRELVLNNCQSCHVWVPIVILQMDKNAWRRNSLEHRSRVEALSDENFTILYEYLSSTFTPERPVPQLPQALLEAGQRIDSAVLRADGFRDSTAMFTMSYNTVLWLNS